MYHHQAYQKSMGKHIIVAYFSAALGFFLWNLDRILVSCSQLYTNCLAILLLYERLLKMGVLDNCKALLIL